MIYLDHAAATPLDKKVLTVMKPYLNELYFNASASYLAAKSVNKDIEKARAKVASNLGVRPAEIIFTAGGTEANNLAVHGVMRQYPDANVVVSAIEHESVLEPAHIYPCHEVKVLTNGIIDTYDLKKQINDKTVLVSVMYANNEIGSVQPLAEIGRLLKEIHLLRIKQGNLLPLYFHTDAAQAGNHLHLFADKLGVDLMTLNAGKLYGPKQSGALYVEASLQLKPQILGGGQERNMRSGTENVANIIGFAEALDKVQAMRADETRRLSALRSSFIKLLSEKLPQAEITNKTKYCLPNNVHITIPGQDNERLMMALDEAGIMCATGSACSADSGEPSHVLKALGMTDKQIRSSLRFTMGQSTTLKEIRQTVNTLAKLIVQT